MNSLEEAVIGVLKDDLYVSDPSVVDKLLENGILSSDVWQEIHKKRSHEQKVKHLVRHLSKADDLSTAFAQLVETLKCSHTHLAKRAEEVIEKFKCNQHEDSRYCQSSVLVEEGKCIRNYVDHQTELIIHRLQEILQNDLFVHDCGLVDGLIAAGILESSDWEEISSAKRNKRKTKKLLLCILKSPKPYTGLLKLRDLLAISHQYLMAEFDNLIQDLQFRKDKAYTTSFSESDGISDTTPSDLEHEEIQVFKKLLAEQGYRSDAIDEMIEKGYLSLDDYNAVHELRVDRHRAAVLSKIITRKSKAPGAAYLALREDASNPSVMPLAEISNKEDVKVLQKIYDVLNKELNNGSLDLESISDQTEIVGNNDALCIVYYFDAMEKIIAGDFNAADSVVEQIDELLGRSRNALYLRGEVMSAKSWLFLKTNRLGLLESFLKENLQLVQSCSNVWSDTATGWLYYELGRCYMAKLDLLRFNNLGKKCVSPNWYNTQNEYIRNAKSFVYTAREYFKRSTSSDGPLGLGFCNFLLVDLLLKCGDKFESVELECSPSDLREADAIIEHVDRGADCIPPTLEIDYMLCVCDLQFRKGNLTEAYEIAGKCYKRCEEMQIAEGMEIAQKRMVRLEKNSFKCIKYRR